MFSFSALQVSSLFFSRVLGQQWNKYSQTSWLRRERCNIRRESRRDYRRLMNEVNAIAFLHHEWIVFHSPESPSSTHSSDRRFLDLLTSILRAARKLQFSIFLRFFDSSFFLPVFEFLLLPSLLFGQLWRHHFLSTLRPLRTCSIAFSFPVNFCLPSTSQFRPTALQSPSSVCVKCWPHFSLHSRRRPIAFLFHFLASGARCHARL